MSGIGILGGTFDPIHDGHLALGQAAYELLKLDQVLFVPAARPPHKVADRVTDPEIRCRMVQLAIAGNPAFELSRMEIDRPGLSFTIDTLRAITAERRAGGARPCHGLLGQQRQVHEAAACRAPGFHLVLQAIEKMVADEGAGAVGHLGPVADGAQGGHHGLDRRQRFRIVHLLRQKAFNHAQCGAFGIGQFGAVAGHIHLDRFAALLGHFHQHVDHQHVVVGWRGAGAQFDILVLQGGIDQAQGAKPGAVAGFHGLSGGGLDGVAQHGNLRW